MWEFACLFAAMVCVNLVFPPQKLHSNGTLQRDTRGFILLKQIHSETNIFLSTKVIWEREKRGFISYLLAWGSDLTCLLKNTAQPEKRDVFMKNGKEIWDVLGDSWKHYRGPWAEIGKYWLDKEPIRLQDSLPCPLKKIIWNILFFNCNK